MHNKRLSALLFLLLALAATTVAGTEEEFLLPEQAFRISGHADQPDRVIVSWEIEDGYYLYRSKLKFRSQTVGIEAGKASTPPGEIRNDEFFGEVEIYRNQVEIAVPLKRAAGAEDVLTLEATSQGCADAGLCYPPQKQTILLELPKLAATEPAAGIAEEAAAAGRVETPTPADVTESAVQPALGALAELNQSLGLGDDEEAFPPPEEAFRFRAEVSGPDSIQLTWDIAEGTYLYQEELSVALADAEDVAIGPFDLPQAEIKKDSVLPDGSIGDVAVYHNRIDLSLPLLRAAKESTRVTLVARYQGCAERGICYPPQIQRVSLNLPAAADVAELPKPRRATDATASAAAGPEPVSEQDQLAELLASRSLWKAIAAFFGFGLLLAFTPCIFPMIPILSGIVVGQGSSLTTSRAFVLSLVYVLAMALTYTAAGVLAGLFGANLQAAFQNVWILSAFVVVFIALALSMFGFYELQLPSSLQSKLAEISNRQQGGTLVGVAIMGLLSALIVGPCVAPPLAGALLFIGQTGDALLGGTALFSMSLGMGVPLIVIGTSAGKLLPKAGAWMDAVKAVFGVLLLAVAIVLLERIVAPAVAMLLWAGLLICSGVYMGALQQIPAGATGWRKLWKGLGTILIAYGLLMLVGAAAGGKDTLQPLRGLAIGGGAEPEQHVAFRRIKTVSDLDRELAAAGASSTPVMLDFYADWCGACKEMERYTFSDPEVAQEMTRFVLLQADVTADDAADQTLMRERFGIYGPPAILFFNESGDELRGHRVVGFKSAAEFADRLRRVAQ